MSATHPQRMSRMLGALATTAVLGVVGLVGCGGDSESDKPASPDTTVLTKNKMLPTTTRVPATLKMPTAPSGKIKR